MTGIWRQAPSLTCYLLTTPPLKGLATCKGKFHLFLLYFPTATEFCHWLPWKSWAKESMAYSWTMRREDSAVRQEQPACKHFSLNHKYYLTVPTILSSHPLTKTMACHWRQAMTKTFKMHRFVLLKPLSHRDIFANSTIPCVLSKTVSPNPQRHY